MALHSFLIRRQLHNVKVHTLHRYVPYVEKSNMLEKSLTASTCVVFQLLGTCRLITVAGISIGICARDYVGAFSIILLTRSCSNVDLFLLVNALVVNALVVNALVFHALVFHA